MEIHACLEQQIIPDCRCNGASLRYWESQYDVMVMGNMLNSPHGWSAWTAYAHYYLYLLTKKKDRRLLYCWFIPAVLFTMVVQYATNTGIVTISAENSCPGILGYVVKG